MLERVPERLDRLSRECAAGGVGDGAGNHHRQRQAVFFGKLLDGEHGGLGVERVEHRLDQNQVGAAIH